MDFAFFAANFGYSRRDYYELTPTEKAFILKAYENKVVTDTTLLRNAVKNAVDNAFRKKGSRFRDLWKKANGKKDKAFERSALEVIRKNEALEGKSWIAKIYAAQRGGGKTA